jgi:hypothetical protein
MNLRDLTPNYLWAQLNGMGSGENTTLISPHPNAVGCDILRSGVAKYLSYPVSP